MSRDPQAALEAYHDFVIDRKTMLLPQLRLIAQRDIESAPTSQVTVPRTQLGALNPIKED